MNDESFHLENAPIIEAIVDIDCDLRPDFDLAVNGPAIREVLKDSYPKMRHQIFQEHKVSHSQNSPPKVDVRKGVKALQFQSEDGKQLVQFRTNGFSFNRLAPYDGLDKYLPEVKAKWELFSELVKPVQIRKIGLRTINRILLPLEGGKVKLDDFLKVGPRLPDEDTLTFVGFLNQHMALEAGTGNHVNIVLTTQQSTKEGLPLILDIDAFRPCQSDPPPWEKILEIITSLRSLKNRGFRNTLTKKCLNLF
ncbi:MAG: TIGR04255 family protein [Verrucomicrobia bacterium]|nr:TIGR04255 family protein [Verrucomicrobiota bacterium]MDA1067439.1 TIGR04255 family protein [Verrucomicrobiota bacterium]